MKLTIEHYNPLNEKWMPFLTNIPTDQKPCCAYVLNQLEDKMNVGDINHQEMFRLFELIIPVFENIETKNHIEQVLEILEENNVIDNRYNRQAPDNFYLSLWGIKNE